MRISDWSSDVCSSDLGAGGVGPLLRLGDAAGGDELHRLGDLLGGLHRLDASAQLSFLAAGHGASALVLVGRQRGAGARKGVVQGKRVSVRVASGGGRIHDKKNQKKQTEVPTVN